MSANPLVSIIICHLGHSQFLKDAIQSALQQTYSPIEIVCIDYSPTDKSQHIIEQYPDQVISSVYNHQSPTTVQDLGLSLSRGEIICFLDADDVLMSHKVSKIVEIFKTYSNIGWCFHALKVIDPKARILLELFHRHESKEYDVRSLVERKGRLPFDLPGISGLCFRRSLLEQLVPLPQAESFSVAEYSLKLTACAVSPGFFLTENLAGQRAYPGGASPSHIDQFKHDAVTSLATAYWIRHRFPSLKNLANNLFARGISAYWQTQGVELEPEDLIQSYLHKLPILEKLQINSKAFYRYFLPS